MKVLYSKFTKERNPRFQLETRIVEKEQGTRFVEKRALDPSGEPHIRSIYENYERFSKRENCYFLKCEYKENRVIFPYVEGESLYAKLAQALDQRDKEAFCRILCRYKEIFRESVYEETTFREEESFAQIFGRHLFPDQLRASRFLDVDLTFDNIIIDENGQTKILDYEWVFECLIPVNFAVYRAASAFYLKHGGQMTGIMTEEEFYAYLEITQEEKAIYKEMNRFMMEFIMSSQASLDPYKRTVRFLNELVKEEVLFSQIYMDTGAGYSEEESIRYPLKNSELQNKLRISLDPYENLQALRFDPLNLPCGVKIYDLYAVTDKGEIQIPLSSVLTNAGEIYGKEMEFFDEDPQIIIEINKEEAWKEIVLHYEILFYREHEKIQQYGNMSEAMKLLEKENERFLKKEYVYKIREEEYRENLAAAVQELEKMKEAERRLRDKLLYIEGTRAYRLLLKEKVEKLGI